MNIFKKSIIDIAIREKLWTVKEMNYAILKKYVFIIVIMIDSTKKNTIDELIIKDNPNK